MPDAERIEQVQDTPQVGATLVAQMVRAAWRSVHQVAGQVLVVEDTQRVDLEAAA